MNYCEQDKAKAQEILYDVWAAKDRRTLDPAEYNWLRQFSDVPEETAIDIALRVCGLKFHWRDIDGLDARARKLLNILQAKADADCRASLRQ